MEFGEEPKSMSVSHARVEILLLIFGRLACGGGVDFTHDIF